jgi:hypothetical protein
MSPLPSVKPYRAANGKDDDLSNGGREKQGRTPRAPRLSRAVISKLPLIPLYAPVGEGLLDPEDAHAERRVVEPFQIHFAAVPRADLAAQVGRHCRL